MPQDAPLFSTQPIDTKEKSPKKKTGTKIIRRKKPTKKKTITQKEIMDGNKEIERANQHKELEMNKRLNSIYQDANGHLPNMKRIKIKRNHPIIKFLFTLIVVAGLLAAVAWAGFFFLPNNNKFSEDKVNLNIQGPSTITLGATTTYVISYANRQTTPLRETVLTVQYPKGFLFISSQPAASNSGKTEWNLGTIKAQEEKNITITGLTYGQTNQAESWRVFLTYKPEKYNYRAQRMTALPVELKQTPFIISVSGPSETAIGQDLEYTFKIINQDKQPIGKLLFSPSWSTIFSLTTSTPTLDKNKQLTIDTNTSTYEWLIKIKGRYASTTEQQAAIAANLSIPMKTDWPEYQIANANATTTLVADNLRLSLAINGNTGNFNGQPDDTLNFTAYLKNNSKQDLTDAQVKLIIDAPSANQRSVMDWGNIKDKYDGVITGTQLSQTARRGEITWDKKLVPKLAKLILHDEINIDLSLPIRGMDKFDLTQLQTHEIKVTAQASYKDDKGNTKTLASNLITILLNSDLKLTTSDTKIINEEKKEQHSIKWLLTNEFHELKNITVTADVYGKVSWQLIGQAPAGQVSYDAAKQKITWIIDKMPLEVDTLALSFTITIDQANPTQNILVTKVKVEAEDTVTGEKINLSGNEIKLN